MFRDVPECSEMFHVPGFIDGLLLIIIEVQYCNVFWDTYTQTIKAKIAKS